MSRLSLYYPAQPYVVTQRYGVHDPETYGPFGFLDHNGEDCQHGYNSRLRAPFPYDFYRTLWQPLGGGNVLTITSKYQYTAPDGKPAFVMLDLMHLSKILLKSGSGDTGDLICIAGNSGAASTGPHTHLQFRWVRRKGANWVDVEKNDANNSFDPHPYWNGLYAVDYKPPVAPILTPTSPEVDLEAIQGQVSQAAVELGDIELQPEPQKSAVLALLEQVLQALSKLLTKG